MQTRLFADLFYCCCANPGNKIGIEMSNTIYHEKQVRQLCAVHALNNLFQEEGAFSKEDLDQICSSLSPNTWISPHKSLLGLGNYDINVIMSALQLKGYEAIWFDKRKDPKCLNLPVITGFILNIPTDYKVVLVQLLLCQKHWVAIREFQGLYYNLDSKLDAPELIGSGDDLITYLRTQLESKEKELFVIIPLNIDRSQAWQLSDSEECSKGSMRVVLPRSASSEKTAGGKTEQDSLGANGNKTTKEAAQSGVGNAKGSSTTSVGSSDVSNLDSVNR